MNQILLECNIRSILAIGSSTKKMADINYQSGFWYISTIDIHTFCFLHVMIIHSTFIKNILFASIHCIIQDMIQFSTISTRPIEVEHNYNFMIMFSYQIALPCYIFRDFPPVKIS